MNEKVSVIIPIYKVEPYIRRCIDSILAQTYHNLEIILVDDGSPDNCPQICDDYAKKDQRIKVIHKPNGGLSDARNAGLKVFTGDYVYFFDGDDYIASNLIEIALQNAIATCADLVIFNYYRVDEEDNLLSASNFRTGIYEINEQNRVDYIVNTLAKYTVGWEAWNRLYKAELIRKHELFFWDNKIIFAEDFGFSLNFAMHVNKISCIGDVLYYYLIRENSIMSTAAKEPRLSAAMSLSKMVEAKINASFTNSVLHKEFPILFYSILYEQLRGATYATYHKAIDSIHDKDYFYRNLRRVLGRGPLIYKHFGITRGSIVLLICFCLNTRSFDRLNVRILESYKKRWKLSEVLEINKPKLRSKKRIFLIGSEDHKNLKEHHIAISIMEYLEATFPEYSIIEITASEYKAVRKLLPFVIRKKDLLCMPGGGSMARVSPTTDYIRKDVMKKYQGNRKVIFPQSFIYSDSEEGRIQLEKDRAFVKRCKNLTLCTRERSSYEAVKQYFDLREGNVVLIPDILLYSNYRNRFAFDRKGAMLLLSSELRSELSEEDTGILERVVRQYVQDIGYNHFQLNSDISIFDRRAVVDSFVQKIAKAELVITDQLHGMLFSVITGTPCIALSNKEEELNGVYEWIKKLGIVKRIQSISETEEGIRELLRASKQEYDALSILEDFEVLTKQLKDYV